MTAPQAEAHPTSPFLATIAEMRKDAVLLRAKLWNYTGEVGLVSHMDKVIGHLDTYDSSRFTP